MQIEKSDKTADSHLHLDFMLLASASCASMYKSTSLIPNKWTSFLIQVGFLIVVFPFSLYIYVIAIEKPGSEWSCLIYCTTEQLS